MICMMMFFFGFCDLGLTILPLFFDVDMRYLWHPTMYIRDYEYKIDPINDDMIIELVYYCLISIEMI